MPETTRLSRDGREVEVAVGDVVPMVNSSFVQIMIIDPGEQWCVSGREIDSPTTHANMSWDVAGNYDPYGFTTSPYNIDIAALASPAAARQRSGVAGLDDATLDRFTAAIDFAALFSCTPTNDPQRTRFRSIIRAAFLAALDQEARDAE